MRRLHAEGALRDVHALLAPDAGALVLQGRQPPGQGCSLVFAPGVPLHMLPAYGGRRTHKAYHKHCPCLGRVLVLAKLVAHAPVAQRLPCTAHPIHTLATLFALGCWPEICALQASA